MNKILKWVLIGGVGILLVGVVAIYFILTGYDYNSLKPKISSAVENATGRKLDIDGDIDLSVGLSPSLVVQDVRFENAPWGSRPELASIKRFEVQVALMPLLSKKIEVERLILVEPDILVETDREGKLNVVFDVPSAPAEKPEQKQPPEKGDGAMTLPSLALNEFVIENAKFTYKDGKTNQTHNALIKQLKANSDSMDSPVKIEMQAMYNDALIEAKGQLGAPSAATDPQKDWLLDLSVKALGVNSTIKGKIRDLLTQSGLDISITAQIDSFDELNPVIKPVLKMEPPPIAPVKLAAKISDTGKMAFKISDLDLTFGEKEMRGQVKGGIGDVVKQEGVDLQVSLQVSDFKPFEPFLKPYLKEGIPPVAPVNFAANVTGSLNTGIAVDNLDLTFGEKELKGQVKGGIGDVFKQEGVDLHVSLRVSDFRPLEPFLKPYLKEGPPPVAPVDFSANVTGGLNTAIAVDNLNLTFGEKSIQGQVKGSVRNAMAPQGIKLTVATDISDFKELANYLKTDLPPLAPVSFKAEVSDAGKMIFKVEDMLLTFAGNDIAGNASADLSKKRPVIKANMASRKMDIHSILNSMKKEKGGGSEKIPAEKPAGEKTVSKRPGKVFPADPLPLDLLKTADADIWYRAADMYLPNLAMHKFKLVVSLKDGNLSVSPLQAEMGGGNLNASVDLKPSADNSTLIDARIVTGRFDIGAMLKEMEITDIMTGSLDVDLKVSSVGASVAELMANLDGYSKMIMENGAIHNRYVGLIGAKMETAVAQILMPAANKKDFTAINCFVNRFDFKKGLADTTVLALDSEYMGVVGDGRIDLGKETLDMAVAPKPKDKVAEVGISLGSLAKNVRIGGTLAEPAVKVDAVEAVKTVEKAIKGINQKGILGALTALEEDATEYEGLCVAAKEAANSGRKLKLEKKAKDAPKPAAADKGGEKGKTTSSTQEKPAGKDGENKTDAEKIGDALKGLFGN